MANDPWAAQARMNLIRPFGEPDPNADWSGVGAPPAELARPVEQTNWQGSPWSFTDVMDKAQEPAMLARAEQGRLENYKSGYAGPVAGVGINELDLSQPNQYGFPVEEKPLPAGGQPFYPTPTGEPVAPAADGPLLLRSTPRSEKASMSIKTSRGSAGKGSGKPDDYGMDALEKKLADAFDAAKKGDQELADRLMAQAEALRNKEVQMDLSPLMSLSDTWFGGDLQSGYKAPTSRAELDKQAQAIQNASDEVRLGMSKKDIAKFQSQLDLAGNKAKMAQAAQQHRESLATQYQIAQMNAAADLAKARMAKGTGAPTADQWKVAGFAKRMENSMGVIDNLAQSGYDPTSMESGITRSIPIWVGGNFARSSESQLQDQAENDFLAAVLRRESGAAISDGEMAQGIARYFPRAGDDPDVLALKAAARNQMLKNFMMEGGNAYQQISGANPTEGGSAFMGSQGPEQFTAALKKNPARVEQGGVQFTYNPATGKYERDRV